MKLKVLIILVFITSTVYSQDRELNNITKFKDGVYLSYKDFMTNSPSLKLNLVNPIKVKYLSKTNNITGGYSKSTTMKLSCSAEELWGICINGIPYIMTYKAKNNDNYSGLHGEQILDEKRNVFHFSKFIFKGHLCYYFISTTYISNQSNRIPLGGANNYNKLKMKNNQYFLKVTTGEKYKFSTSNLLQLIVDDNELYIKFKKLSERKRGKEIFNVFREYNERNPIFLPDNLNQ